jgi:hypothetical protein
LIGTSLLSVVAMLFLRCPGRASSCAVRGRSLFTEQETLQNGCAIICIEYVHKFATIVDRTKLDRIKPAGCPHFEAPPDTSLPSVSVMRGESWCVPW